MVLLPARGHSRAAQLPAAQQGNNVSRRLLLGAPVVGRRQGDGLCVAPALQPTLHEPGGVAVRHTQAVCARPQAGCGRRYVGLGQTASLVKAHEAAQHACKRFAPTVR